jgi:hypothetical protein
MILFGFKLRRGQPNPFSLPPRRLGMSSLTQKPGIKNRIRPSRTWIKVKNPNAPAASRALDRSFQECRSPFRLLPFLESAFCFLLAHRNDISPRWASTDAKIVFRQATARQATRTLELAKPRIRHSAERRALGLRLCARDVPSTTSPLIRRNI